ncbi:hypothetical protein STAQ_26200 [Allostella sp. ATCC 35155]|nr:hypothetical protein STAQ_26200 [Stella sp. ATCC 35155]
MDKHRSSIEADIAASPAEIDDRVSAFLDGRSAWPVPHYLCVRRFGRRWHHAWLPPGSIDPIAEQLASGGPDAVAELFLPVGAGRPVPSTRPPARWTGLHGLHAIAGDREMHLAPSQMIAANMTWERALAHGTRLLGRPPDIVRRLCGQTVLLSPGRPLQARPWYRSGPPVHAIDLASLAGQLGDWLVRNTDADGRLVYKYWPSRGRESTADNTIRQFMGTLALGRFARRSQRPDATSAWLRNLDHQIARYFQTMPDGSGVIAHGGSAKLGAAAIAGLCLLEAPPTPARSEVLERLIQGIERLWSADGAFRTFHFPAARNDNQNFYPGEACLFWAKLFTARRDPAVLARLLRSLDHYRDWHRRQPNPAFVPWHAQAHAALHAATGMTERVPFVFEMTDWLLPMQQWETAPAEDMRGRFYAPDRPEFGPPHAASTGAYMEGLAAAITLARSLGDGDREERYHTVFLRAARNIRQLAFVDEEDFFNISRRSRVAGGVRTEVYDNTIRVDNIQHPLMAILMMLP